MSDLPNTDAEDQDGAAGFFGTGNKSEKAPKRSAQQQSARKALGITPQEAEGRMRDPGDMKKKMAGAMAFMNPEFEGAASAIEAAPVIGSAAAKAVKGAQAGMGRGDFLKGLGAAGAAATVAGSGLAKKVGEGAQSITHNLVPHADALKHIDSKITADAMHEAIENYPGVIQHLMKRGWAKSTERAGAIFNDYIKHGNEYIKRVESHGPGHFDMSEEDDDYALEQDLGIHDDMITDALGSLNGDYGP